MGNAKLSFEFSLRGLDSCRAGERYVLVARNPISAIPKHTERMGRCLSSTGNPKNLVEIPTCYKWSLTFLENANAR